MSEQNPRSGHVPRGYNPAFLPSERARERLEAYEAILRLWAPKMDLVAPGELDRFAERHLADSLKALPLVEALPPGPAADVGSGAGLPGIPLAIAGGERPWRLLEPRRRRASFLEEVVRELGLDHVEVVASTAEDAPAGLRDHVAATARALAAPQAAFELLLPLLREGGTAMVWVGESAQLPPEAGLSTRGLATMRKMAQNRENLD